MSGTQHLFSLVSDGFDREDAHIHDESARDSSSSYQYHPSCVEIHIYSIDAETMRTLYTKTNCEKKNSQFFRSGNASTKE